MATYRTVVTLPPETEMVTPAEAKKATSQLVGVGPRGPQGPKGDPGAVQKVSGVAPDGSGNVDLSGKVLQYAPSFIADGTTDNAAAFAAVAANAGVQQLPKGVLLCKSPIYLQQRSVTWQGQGSNPGTTSPLGTIIRFDATALMTGGNTATVATTGTSPGPYTWTFTVPAGHGLAAGNVIRTTGFANAGFNQLGLVLTSVTSTTLVVANMATNPAASGSGKVNPHMIVLGATNATTAAALLRDVQVDCNGIPGAGGVYSNSVQEMGGLAYVTVTGHNGGGWGVTMDGSNGSNMGVWPLNYVAEKIRTVRLSTDGDANSGGYDEWGGAVSSRGAHDLTCVGGVATCNTQVRFNKSNGLRFYIHAEKATDGIVIGDQAGCAGLTVLGYTGNATVTNAVRIAAPATGTNTQVRVGSGLCNGATNVFADDLNGVVVPKATNYLGDWQTDINGVVIRHSLGQLPQTPTVTVGANAGTGATATVVGDDLAGTVTVTTGTSPALGVQATVTFGVQKPAAAVPRLVLVTAMSNPASNARPVGASPSRNSFFINAATAPAASSSCVYAYSVIY